MVLYYPIAEVVLYVRASLFSDCKGGAIRAGFVVISLDRWCYICGVRCFAFGEVVLYVRDSWFYD